MDSFPESIKAVVEAAARKYPEVGDAVAAAERAARKLPEFPGMVDALVRDAIRSLVHNVRHNDNVKRRRENREYDVLPKVKGTSERVNAIHRSLYYHNIGGKILGMLTGAELYDVGFAERNRAIGSMFNYRLCMKLCDLVPEDKTVQDAVSERKLKAIFKELEEQKDQERAEAV